VRQHLPAPVELVLRVFLARRPIVAKKLYVGNLSYDTTGSDLERLFGTYGTVESAQVIMDRDTNRSKGFGFVEMENAQAAIDGLNGKEVNGRALTVNEAKPREDRGGGGGRSGGGGGRGGYGGGGGGRGGYGGGGGGGRY
jgi:RNA recognition motif-containing protein